MSTPTENPNVPEAPIFDPFPEPNTMPAGWDLSGFTREPGSVSVVPAEEGSEV